MRKLLAVTALLVACSSPAFASVDPPPQTSSQNFNIRRIFGMEAQEKSFESLKPRWREPRRYYHRWRPVAHHHHYQRRVYARTAMAVAPEPDQGFSLFGFRFYTPTASLGGDTRLLHVAERYVGGGNFTGFNGPWCAASVGLWLREAGYSRLGSLAAVSYAHYGRPSAPKVGAVAVLPHHIGIVAKVYPTSILLLSGNHRHNVGYGMVSIRRIVAFRQPV
jgi:hypothetical protein